MNWYANLISLCHAAAAPGHWPVALPVLLFAMGSFGSVLHCGPMCGGFVLAQASDAMACIPLQRLNERSRLMAGILPLYHLGRITTYAVLGGLSGGGVALLSHQALLFHAAGGGVLLLAAVLMALQAARRWLPVFDLPFWCQPGRWMWRGIRPWLVRTRRLGMGRHYVVGLILGFLPCGLLGTALLAASDGGSAARGAADMAAFGLGTTPLLALLGIMGGRGIAAWWQQAIPVLLLLAAGLLAIIGVTQIRMT